MTRLEAAQAAMIEAKISIGGHVRYQTQGCQWCFSQRPAGANVAWAPMIEEGQLIPAIEEVLGSARAIKRAIDILVFPSSTPKGLPLRLRRQWRLMGPMYLPGMVLDLEDPLPQPSHPTSLVTDWALQPKTNRPLMWWVPKVQKADWWKLHSELHASGCLHLWEADLDGSPAACASSFIHNGFALITSVLTLPEARGRGLGASVMRACLNHARELGCDQAGLLTHKRAKEFYERLGFKEEGMFASLYYSKTRAERECLPRTESV